MRTSPAKAGANLELAPFRPSESTPGGQRYLPAQRACTRAAEARGCEKSRKLAPATFFSETGLTPLNPAFRLH